MTSQSRRKTSSTQSKTAVQPAATPAKRTVAKTARSAAAKPAAKSATRSAAVKPAAKSASRSAAAKPAAKSASRSAAAKRAAKTASRPAAAKRAAKTASRPAAAKRAAKTATRSAAAKPAARSAARSGVGSGTKRKSKSSPASVSKAAKQRVAPAARAKKSSLAWSALVEARDSPIHGRGVYAIAPIKKGTRIFEYIGERISHAEADRRYENKAADDGHTFLFIASNRTVIDAGTKGNDARFINHSCKPNCETVIEKSRVFIDAIRNIKPGEELGYEYQLTWESTDDPAELALYACRCGAKRCRGTMLDRQPVDRKA